jgi:uncharacterized delta-60 repeat protein
MKVHQWALAALVVLGLNVLRAQQPGSFDTNYITVSGTDQMPLRFFHARGNKLLVAGGFTNYGGTGRAAIARLNSDGSLDTAFTVSSVMKYTPAVVLNGQVLLQAQTNRAEVQGMAELPDNRVLVVGEFNRINGATVGRAALLNADGSVGAFNAQIGELEASQVIRTSDGKFYIGGGGLVDGTDAASGARVPVVRLNADGSRDGSFASPRISSMGLLSANAYRLYPGPGDTLYAFVAGASTNFQPRYEILRLTSAGAYDTTFADGGRALVNNLQAMVGAVSPSGELYLSGTLNYRGQAVTKKVNRIALDGSIDTTFVAAAEGQFAPAGISVQPDGKLLLVNANSGLTVTRLNLNGTRDAAYVSAATVPTSRLLVPIAVSAGPDGAAYCGGSVYTPTFTPISGVFRVNGDPNTAPSLVSHPLSQTNTLGARTRFVVSAQGAQPFTYQWRRNGQDIGGATSAELVFTATANDDGAEYDCIVSNALGSAPSNPGRLTVLAATAGSLFRETDVAAGADGSVQDLRWDSEGRLLAAGGFARFHGTNRVRLARLLEKGSIVDPAFDTSALGAGFSQVENIELLGTGKLIVSGQITPGFAARINANGSAEAAWNVGGVGGASPSDRFSEGPDGRIFVGAFSWNGVNLTGGYGRLSADGVRDAAFAVPAMSLNSTAVLALPDGKALVSGFPNGTAAGPEGLPTGILRINADGSRDNTFFSGPIGILRSAATRELIRQADGKILAVGRYELVIWSRTYNAAVIRLLADGRLDPLFNPEPAMLPPLGFGVSGVRAGIQADGRILLITSDRQLLRLWPNGIQEPGFIGPVAGPSAGSAALYALAVSTDNDIFVGGTFTTYGGLPRTNFARVNGGPLIPTPAAPTIEAVPGRVIAYVGTNLSLTVTPGGEGPFRYQWRRNNNTGLSLFSDIAWATNSAITLTNLAVTDSGLFQVSVANAGGTAVSALITLMVFPDPQVPGRRDGSFAAISALANRMAPNPDGSVFAVQTDGITRHFEDGTRDTNFVTPPNLVLPDNFTGNVIDQILRQPDGKLLVVGRLDTNRGPCNVAGNLCFTPKRGVVRLLADGSYDPSFFQDNLFDAGDVTRRPTTVAVQSDGRILVGGGFVAVNGLNYAGIIRLNPDGRLDETFRGTNSITLELTGPPRSLPPNITMIGVLPDDRFFISGSFNRVHGQTRTALARLQADGTLDASFAPPVNGHSGSGTAGLMTLYSPGPITPAGGIFIFGEFRTNDVAPRRTGLRLNADGSIDHGFAADTDFQINYGALQPDGKLIISGQFTRVSGQNRGQMTRLNADGSLDTTFDFQGGSSVGQPMYFQADGRLLSYGQRFFTGVVPEVASPRLDYSFTAGNFQLAWPSGFKLQRTTSLAPAAWTDVASPSPFVVPLAGPGEFYRVVPGP